MAFNKKEYDKNLQKERRKNIKIFKVDLILSEYEEIDKTLKNFNIQKKIFLQESFKKFKEEKKMKKYYIYCGTDNYKLVNNKWKFQGGTTINLNDEYIGIYESYEQAFEIYNSIEIEKKVQGTEMYSDYKQIYEIDNSIEDEDDIILDEAKLINEEYSFNN